MNYCHHCGAKMVEYKHGLSKGLCRSLAKVVTKFGERAMFGQDIAQMGLKSSEYCNFQKLRYWGLVVKVGDDGGKGGKWRVTRKGMDFVSGNLTVPRFVWTYRGRVERVSDKMISIEQVTQGWKFRRDYARERVAHG